MFMHIEPSSRVACRLIAVVAALLVMAGTAAGARADGLATPQGQELAPVPRLFERVHSTFSGRILTIALTLSNSPAYEVKLLTESGNVLMLSYNATTLRLDSVVGHRDVRDEKNAAVRIAGDGKGGAGKGDDGEGSGRGGGRDGGDDDNGDDDHDDHDDHGGDSGSGGGNSGPGGGDD